MFAFFLSLAEDWVNVYRYFVVANIKFWNKISTGYDEEEQKSKDRWDRNINALRLRRFSHRQDNRSNIRNIQQQLHKEAPHLNYLLKQ